MSILIVDFLCVEAHRVFNLNIIRAVSRISDVTLMSINDYYNNNLDELNLLGVHVANYQTKEYSQNTFCAKYRILKNMLLCSKELHKGNYDVVISLAHDTLVSVFLPLLFRNKKIGLFHHKNLDELTTIFKRFVFGLYKSSCYHFVFEDYFRDYLNKENGVALGHIFVIPHPIVNHKYDNIQIENDCIGLCHENEESFLDNLVQLIKKESNTNKMSFVFRTKKDRASTKNTRFINTFLDYSEYEAIFASAKSVFVPLPHYYKYRLSASIYDAFSWRKVVYTTSFCHAQEYSHKYPGICEYIKDPEDLIGHLLNNSTSDVVASFDRFIQDHTIEAVRNKIQKAIIDMK